MFYLITPQPLWGGVLLGSLPSSPQRPSLKLHTVQDPADMGISREVCLTRQLPLHIVS